MTEPVASCSPLWDTTVRLAMREVPGDNIWRTLGYGETGHHHDGAQQPPIPALQPPEEQTAVQEPGQDLVLRGLLSRPDLRAPAHGQHGDQGLEEFKEEDEVVVNTTTKQKDSWDPGGK